VNCPVCQVNSAYWDGTICMECVQVRARVASGNKRCPCRGRKQKPQTVETRSRSWVACDRCLGTIKQLT
jgi:hypothetical protein